MFWACSFHLDQSSDRDVRPRVKLTAARAYSVLTGLCRLACSPGEARNLWTTQLSTTTPAVYDPVLLWSEATRPTESLVIQTQPTVS